jgi:transcriptional regulator with XRE-family HTH domain
VIAYSPCTADPGRFAVADPDSPKIGARIRQRREEAGLSLSRLAQEAGVSKGYLWSLEKGETDGRPSGRTLYEIARVLGTTMADLLGRELLVDSPTEIPDSLKHFADREGLTDADVQMLASVNFRGRQPTDHEGWALVWGAIKASVRSSHR